MNTVCIDFDGVIHSYTTPWKSDAIVPDPPLEGAREFIDILRQEFVVIIFTTRARSVEGAAAVRQWLGKYGIMVDDVRNQKPPAICYVDDRGFKFEGNFQDALKAIQNFRTWQEVLAQQMTGTLDSPERAIPTELEPITEAKQTEETPEAGRSISQTTEA